MISIPIVGWRAGFIVSVTTGLAALLAPSLAPGETIHFLVAERPEFAVHGDSYVLPLSDPAAIAHARALVDSTPGELPSIAVAKIAPGADAINRDHLAEDAPAWSWHVTEIVEFADLTAEILDGWPTFVESDVAGWIANTDGTIGFWTYTVVAELPAIPEPSTAAMMALATLLLVATRHKFKRVVAIPHALKNRYCTNDS